MINLIGQEPLDQLEVFARLIHDLWRTSSSSVAIGIDYALDDGPREASFLVACADRVYRSIEYCKEPLFFMDGELWDLKCFDFLSFDNRTQRINQASLLLQFAKDDIGADFQATEFLNKSWGVAGHLAVTSFRYTPPLKTVVFADRIHLVLQGAEMNSSQYILATKLLDKLYRFGYLLPDAVEKCPNNQFAKLLYDSCIEAQQFNLFSEIVFVWGK